MTANKLEKLDALRQLAAVMSDQKMAEVRRLSSKRTHTLAQIANLRPSHAGICETGQIVDAIAALAYQNWADTRRKDLQTTLALQTAAFLNARDLAAQAFGKSQALETLVKSTRAAQKRWE